MRQLPAKRSALIRRDSGLTLVELVVAMVIIAGVLMALIAVQIAVAGTIVEARKRTQATAYANEAMEQLRAIPWNYINIGVHSGFNTSGQDPYVTGTSIRLPGAATNRTLKVGTQSLASPRPPLFDASGSNVHVVSDAAGTNTEFTVRAYVLEPDVGSVNTVGLAVVVSWEQGDGDIETTVIESTAYRGTGCGDPAEAPYLSTCQATFEGISSSGTLITSVIATTVPDAANNTSPVNLLHPTPDIFASLTMRSASVGASAQGRQVTNVMAAAQFGGTEKDDSDDATQPSLMNWVSGYATAEVRASDDKSQTLLPPHVGTTSLRQAVNAETAWTLSHPSTEIDFLSRSDYRRPVSATASSTNQCKANIPAGQPCAYVEMTNAASFEEGSGYINMRVGSQHFRLSRRLADFPPPANNDQAWIARYSTAPSTADSVGCRTISGAGCMAAGATRTMARLAIGQVVNSDWTGQASDGLLVFEGRAACSNGFTETVMVQRGSSQRTTPAETTRCGQVRWWNGTGYSTQVINDLGFDAITTAPVTWTNGTYSVTAVASFDASGESEVPTGTDAYCASESCAVRAQTGTVNVSAVYQVSGPGFEYLVISTTTVEGPSATVVYQEAPSVAAP